MELMKTERVSSLETKSRLSKILVDSEQFLGGLKKARKSEFEVSGAKVASGCQLLDPTETVMPCVWSRLFEGLQFGRQEVGKDTLGRSGGTQTVKWPSDEGN